MYEIRDKELVTDCEISSVLPSAFCLYLPVLVEIFVLNYQYLSDYLILTVLERMICLVFDNLLK